MFCFIESCLRTRLDFMVSIFLPSQLVTDHKVMVYSTTGSREGNSRIQYSLTLPLCAWISGIYSVVRLSSAVHLVINQQMYISTLNTICFCQIKHLEGPREKKSKLSPCPKAASKVRVKSSAASGGFYFIRAWLGWKTAPQQGKKKVTAAFTCRLLSSLEGLHYYVTSLRTWRL